MVVWNAIRIPISRSVDRILSPENVSEFLGTFFLVFTVIVNVLQRPPASVLERIPLDELQRRSLSPLSIGSILMVMVYATGGISGGHFNPAVTVALHLVHPRMVPLNKTLRYILVQCLGALFAGLMGWAVMQNTFTLKPGESRTAFDVMSVETFFATALCLVVLNCATTKQDAGNQYFGLAIGFTVASAAFGIGPVSGCAINPAVSFGVMMTNFIRTGGGLAYIVVYFGTPLLGSFLASLLFRTIRRVELLHSEYEESITEDDKPTVLSQ